MKDNSKKDWKLLTIALVLILGGSLLANAIQTVGGSVTIKDVRWAGSDGTMLSALLYIPKGVSVEKPAPALLVIGGGDTNREAFHYWSLEFARRGYVVLNFDKYTEGYSEGVPMNRAQGYGGPEALRYLLSLDIIDHDNVGMVGHSMGGSAITSAAFRYPDGYKAMFVVGSSGAVMDKDVDPTTLKNFAYICGIEDKCRYDPSAVAPIFGTEDLKSIQAEKIYGSFEDGTARALYYVPYPHATQIITPGPLNHILNWIQQAIPAPNPIPGSNQIYLWRYLGSMIAFVGFVLFLLPLGTILLRTPFFKSLAQPVPEFKGNTGKAWWIGAVLTVLILTGSLFIFVSLATKLIPNSTFWPMGRPNRIMGWALLGSLVTVIIILLNHYVLKGDRNATAHNYGLTSQDGKVEWRNIGKSLLLAFFVFGIGYLVLVLVYRWLLVEFSVFEVAFRLLTPARCLIVLRYLIPWMISYIILGANLHGLMRPKDGKTKLWKEILINVLLLAPWFFLWFPLYFGTFYAGTTHVSSAGRIEDWIWAFPPMLTMVAVISTYYYHKTGRVYVGAFLNAILVVWTLVAGNMLA